MFASLLDAVKTYIETFPNMTYDSFFFIGFFFVLLILYWIMPVVSARQAVIFIGNVFFYLFAGSIELLLVIFVTSLVVYFAARSMGRIYALLQWKSEGMPKKEQVRMLASYKRRAKVHLVFALLFVFGLLIFVKGGRLLGFEEVRSFRDFGFRKIIVPLGISYYTLSSAGYLLDVYWRKTKPDEHYFRLLLCMTFFPTIVQGPICHYDKMMEQFGSLKGFRYDNTANGFQRMLWGLFKKSVIANRLSVFEAAAFASLDSLGSIETLVAIAANVFCLYADFSGCMDIVAGVAEVFGVTLEENFKEPFFSRSAAEFWRRWHITLGGWFRDYLYMPLATSKSFIEGNNAIRKLFGKRIAKIRGTAVPLMLVWILTGLWHGTGIDYVTWGLYWGIVITIETAFAPEFKKINKLLRVNENTFSHHLFQMIRTFIFFSIGRMLTVFGKPSGVFSVAKRIFMKPDLNVFTNGALYRFGVTESEWAVLIFGIFLMWLAAMLHTKCRIRETLAQQSILIRWPIYIAAIVLLLIYGTYGPGYNASSFIYGNF